MTPAPCPDAIRCEPVRLVVTVRDPLGRSGPAGTFLAVERRMWGAWVVGYRLHTAGVVTPDWLLGEPEPADNVIVLGRR